MVVTEAAEARKASRRRVLETGLIRFGDTSVSCVIRNLSTAGAALDVGLQTPVPDCFTLIIVRERKIHSCNVIWRKGMRVGVSFE
jgi:PilZ domain